MLFSKKAKNQIDSNIKYLDTYVHHFLWMLHDFPEANIDIVVSKWSQTLSCSRFTTVENNIFYKTANSKTPEFHPGSKPQDNNDFYYFLVAFYIEVTEKFY
jgi:hypothetical protein